MHRILFCSILMSSFCPPMQAGNAKLSKGIDQPKQRCIAHHAIKNLVINPSFIKVVNAFENLINKTGILILDQVSLTKEEAEYLKTFFSALAMDFSTSGQFPTFKGIIDTFDKVCDTTWCDRTMLKIKIGDAFIRVLLFPEFQTELTKVVGILADAADDLPSPKIPSKRKISVFSDIEEVLRQLHVCKPRLANWVKYGCEISHNMILDQINGLASCYTAFANRMTYPMWGAPTEYYKIRSLEQPICLSAESLKVHNEVIEFSALSFPSLKNAKHDVDIKHLKEEILLLINAFQAAGIKTVPAIIERWIKTIEEKAILTEENDPYDLRCFLFQVS